MPRINTYPPDVILQNEDLILGSDYKGTVNGVPIYETKSFSLNSLGNYLSRFVYVNPNIYDLARYDSFTSFAGEYDADGNLISLSTAFADQVLSVTTSDRYANAQFVTNLATSVGLYDENGNLIQLSEAFANQILTTTSTDRFATSEFTTNLAASFGTYDENGNILSYSNATFLDSMKVYVDAELAISTSIQSLTASVDDNAAAITEESTARATATEALATQITTLTATVDTNTAAITTESTTRATETEALATQITTLSATVDDNTAAITTESTTRATETEALATQITTLSATVDDNTAAITTESTTRATETDALATQITTLSATVDDNTAAITTEATTRATETDALATQITTLSATVDDNTAAITTEATTRATETDALATQITTLSATVDNNAAAITTEATTRATQDTALATQITTLSSTVDDNTAAITTEATTRATQDTALSTQITTLTSTVDDNTAAITSEATTRANETSALSTAIDTLTATVDDNTAAISAEATTRADETSALSSTIDTLTATVDDNAAAITAEQTARANADGALSTAIDTISATVDGNTASISTNATAIATTDGKLNASYGVHVNAGGKIAGLKLLADSTTTSSFIAQADTFGVDMPNGSRVFTVNSSGLLLNGSGVFTGNISARSGDFGGWNIQDNNITGPELLGHQLVLNPVSGISVNSADWQDSRVLSIRKGERPITANGGTYTFTNVDGVNFNSWAETITESVVDTLTKPSYPIGITGTFAGSEKLGTFRETLDWDSIDGIASTSSNFVGSVDVGLYVQFANYFDFRTSSIIGTEEITSATVTAASTNLNLPAVTNKVISLVSSQDATLYFRFIFRRTVDIKRGSVTFAAKSTGATSGLDIVMEDASFQTDLSPGGIYVGMGTTRYFRIDTNSYFGSYVVVKGGISTDTISKTSGSFKIDHPLPDMEATHDLVHSFVESPQANNIYRGQVNLVDGQSVVNLDEAAGMTEGTFVALNRDIHTFTSNESDWDHVRGTVVGNILTIECQNPESTAKVSWLVIGERHDKHMFDTHWTDENGKVIVEPLKEDSV